MARATIPMSLAEIIEPSRSALIVWDMQVGIGGKAHNLAEILPNLHALIDAARATGALVIWSRHVAPPIELTSAPALRGLLKRQNVASPAELKPFMQSGTPDVEIIEQLQPRPDEPIIEKSTPSFFVGTPLDVRLRARGITSLILTGVATELGIEMTARHAGTLGLFAVVVEDAVGSFSQAGHDLGLAFLRTAVDVVPTAEIAKVWRR